MLGMVMRMVMCWSLVVSVSGGAMQRCGPGKCLACLMRWVCLVRLVCYMLKVLERDPGSDEGGGVEAVIVYQAAECPHEPLEGQLSSPMGVFAAVMTISRGGRFGENGRA